MKKLLWSAPVLLLLIACNKDKFQTKPQISLKSITGFVPFQGRVEAILSFTDKEGDLGDGKLFYLPIMQNVRPPAGTPPIYDTITYAIPTFPDKSNGDIQLNIDHQNIYRDVQQRGGADKNDTLILKIYVRDRAGNTSDTLTTGSFVVQG